MRRSSPNGYTSTPAGSWRARNGRGNSPPDREEQENGHATVSWPPRNRLDEGGSIYAPWTLFEERVRTGPFGLSRFPFQPHSPVRILVLNTDGTSAGAVDPVLRQFVRDYSPSRIRGEWQLGLDPEPEDPGLTEEEFKKAMKKLKRHVHNPTYPRKRAWKRGLFSGRNILGNNQKVDEAAAGDGEEDKEEGKECTVCLEAFGANEQVTVTPCNHMFHHDCIVPWVKKCGQCPVCRFAFCERAQQPRRRETALVPSSVNTNYGGMAGAAGGVWDDDLFYLIRAMEEALNWVNLYR